MAYANKYPQKDLPVIATRNTVLFPGQVQAFHIGRSPSVKALAQSQKGEGWVLVIAQKNQDSTREWGAGDLYRVGTLGKVEGLHGDPKKGYRAVIRGVLRIQVEEFRDEDGLVLARGTEANDKRDMDETTSRVLMQNLKDIAGEILVLLQTDAGALKRLLAGIEDPIALAHLAAQYLDVAVEKKQKILELLSLKHRYLLLLELMAERLKALQVQNKINERLSKKLNRQQKEHLLREQIRAAQEELGEGSEGSVFDEYREKIVGAKMPEEVEKIARDQLKRLESLGTASPESHVVRNYLDILVAMPWAEASDSDIDLDRARRELDGDHYGLDKIKQRIVQHLAVMKLKKDKRGSILLFVGPPGVGKTSLGKSIAKALGRKFVRASLGGVRDEAEIRGHRRTYIGALPGRIIEGIKRSGVNNPVFMLDEIDKLSRGFAGDPAGALLEVLDPEQNSHFLDHYLDVPFDLSNVFFIATANFLESIPEPLLDRMERIDLTGYTTVEKLHIACRHLWPKQLAEHGVSRDQLEIPEDVLMHLITHYTREAGVRELERKIAALVRGSSEKILAANASFPIVIELEDLERLLGAEKFYLQVAEMTNPPGVVTGMAWTPMGGEILFVESKAMPGSGKLTLTGQLGEVMKESAQIALSLARSNLAGMADAFSFDQTDVHIHVPAGAIPKDGPSAGVTMLTALSSLILRREVDPKLAMTGEITLRGAVMPVGGIKEKVIAAHRAGSTHIILPKRNERDLRDIPEEVKRDLKFTFAERAEEVLETALGIALQNRAHDQALTVS